MNKKAIIIVMAVILAALFVMDKYEVGPFRSNAGELWPE